LELASEEVHVTLGGGRGKLCFIYVRFIKGDEMVTDRTTLPHFISRKFSQGIGSVPFVIVLVTPGIGWWR